MVEVLKYASEHGLTPEEQRSGQIGFKNEKDATIFALRWK